MRTGSGGASSLGHPDGDGHRDFRLAATATAVPQSIVMGLTVTPFL